jgi:flagellar biosynthesis protein FlhF
MQIKRFEAKNMTTALRRVKEELGPEAVILSARSKRRGKGFFGSLKYAGVEVSAAVDNQLPGVENPRTLPGEDPYRRFNNGQVEKPRTTRGRLNQTRLDNRSAIATSRPVNGHRKKTASRSSVRAMSSLYQQILHQEVDRGIASELIEEIKRIPASEEILSNGDIKPHIGSLLEEMGVAVESNPFVNGRPTIMAFVGTTGVGKTTTIAKLAARQVNQGKKSVGLITMDNYSIAANHQLEIYAQIIGTPLETAASAGDLKKAVKRFKDKDIILIDTLGINPKDQVQLQELKTCLAGISSVKTQLIMSATTKEKDCIAISEAFKDIGVHQILFTKTDESSIFGNIVNVLIRTNLPLSFLCGGRKVPDDIEAGTVQRLVDLLFSSPGHSKSRRTGASDTEKERPINSEDKSTEQPNFVANKNSDVYHATDCKWAKKIKPANIIKFSGAREAEGQNFLPCRSCNPDGRQQSPGRESHTEKQQYYSYR